MRHHILAASLALTALPALPPTVLHAQDAEHRTRCTQAVELFRKTDPQLDKFFQGSVGYAIFPSVGKGAFVVGGAAGTGCLYQGGEIIGEAKLAQVTVGLQLGGQSYAEVIFFQNDHVIAAFKRNTFEMSAQVSAVAAASGVAATAKYRQGVLVFTVAKGGLMYEASVGGQKFTFKPLAKDSVSTTGAEKPKD